ncbi:MAG: heavy-metal-associated domain-containing protein [Clostridiales bacterium]|nr:heavy-metal-associated domain-containing protein [Clostridiales bacterium]
MKKKILIEGMSCGHCVNHVKGALKELEGVVSAEVDLDTKTARLEATKDIKDEEIRSIIEEVGYEVVGIESL